MTSISFRLARPNPLPRRPGALGAALRAARRVIRLSVPSGSGHQRFILPKCFRFSRANSPSQPGIGRTQGHLHPVSLVSAIGGPRTLLTRPITSLVSSNGQYRCVIVRRARIHFFATAWGTVHELISGVAHASRGFNLRIGPGNPCDSRKCPWCRIMCRSSAETLTARFSEPLQMKPECQCQLGFECSQ